MRWNDEKGYIAYKSAQENLKSLLGISETPEGLRCDLAPYVTYILSYISGRLLLMGPGVGIQERLNEVFDIYTHGADLICLGAGNDLAWELGIGGEDIYVEGSEIPYMPDRFIFAWADTLGALCCRLRLQYAGILYQGPSGDCGCPECGGPGQTTYDYENYRSGIYPEDEEYSYYPWNKTSPDLWRAGVDVPECTKCSRK